jgi:predicted ATPase
MTSLEEYQKNEATAQPWASVHLFDELVESKAVGLLRAEVSTDRLTTDEAIHLLLLVRRYYGSPHYDKAWTFNHAGRHWDMDKFLADCP